MINTLKNYKSHNHLVLYIKEGYEIGRFSNWDSLLAKAEYVYINFTVYYIMHTRMPNVYAFTLGSAFLGQMGTYSVYEHSPYTVIVALLDTTLPS